jgi:hypothetical protein
MYTVLGSRKDYQLVDKTPNHQTRNSAKFSSVSLVRIRCKKHAQAQKKQPYYATRMLFNKLECGPGKQKYDQ